MTGRSDRLAADAAWNYAALAATMIVGAAVTFLISWRLGTIALGVFAQLYAVHVIAAQLAVFGIHDSTQKHVAEREGGADAAVVAGALGLVLIPAATVAGLLLLLADPIGRLVGSPAVGRGLILVAPGVLAFAVNKVLFAVLNGRGQLKRYAAMQIVRAACVLAAVIGVVVTAGPVHTVGAIFALAEIALLPGLLVAVRPAVRRAAGTLPDASWWRRHLGFGGRGLVAAILVETHLRVDVAMLAYFASDRLVGVYAFASLFAEGIYQVPSVIRAVAYPTIVQLASRGDRLGVARLVRRLSVASGAVSGAVAILVAIGYPIVAGWLDPEFVTAGWMVLLILLFGMALSAFFVPFDQLLLQSGQPGRQSVLMATYVGANVVLNLALIPRFGLVGAAMATAIALVLSAALLLVASRIWLGYRPMVLLHRATAS